MSQPIEKRTVKLGPEAVVAEVMGEDPPFYNKYD